MYACKNLTTHDLILSQLESESSSAKQHRMRWHAIAEEGNYVAKATKIIVELDPRLWTLGKTTV